MSFSILTALRTSQILGATKQGFFRHNLVSSKLLSSTRYIICFYFLIYFRNAKSQVSEQLENINKVKSMRPRSPFYIYEPQLTSVLSIFHRVSGVGLGLVFYGVAIAFPIYDLKSTKVVKYLETVPSSIKMAAKFTLAFPFMFHNLNGVRHLIWDTASSLTLKGVYSSGYAVLAGTVVSSLALASV
ncbi:hypothetical protein DSO57_1031300 [Entomophthora muscae]|uniref:Uncharacterized protein n=1 Tax=Entomophthora muscae TaxID=34485 RepID=A0ACC2RRT5_9FUNG|nr:hypothetical protein DSO57_1031300 [Entomophthora muscae]